MTTLLPFLSLSLCCLTASKLTLSLSHSLPHFTRSLERTWRRFLSPTWRRRQVVNGNLRDLPHLPCFIYVCLFGAARLTFAEGIHLCSRRLQPSHLPPHPLPHPRDQALTHIHIHTHTNTRTHTSPQIPVRHVWGQKDEKHVPDTSFGKDLGRQGGEEGASLAAAQSLWGRSG